MTVDPNETARQAFGYAPPATSPAPAERAPQARELAAWRTRAGAWLLDQLVLAGFALVLMVAVLLVSGVDGERPARLVLYAVVLPVNLLYAPLLMARRGDRNGQTWGKQALGIRVVRIDGAPVGFGDGLLRTALGQQLPMALTLYLYAFADYLWPLRDARNQALHDKLAKTLVVSAAAAKPPAAAPLPEHAAWLVEQPAEEPLTGGWLPPRAPGA